MWADVQDGNWPQTTGKKVVAGLILRSGEHNSRGFRSDHEAWHHRRCDLQRARVIDLVVGLRFKLGHTRVVHMVYSGVVICNQLVTTRRPLVLYFFHNVQGDDIHRHTWRTVRCTTLTLPWRDCVQYPAAWVLPPFAGGFCIRSRNGVTQQHEYPPPLLLGVSLLGVGTVLRLERDAWLVIKWTLSTTATIT